MRPVFSSFPCNVILKAPLFLRYKSTSSRKIWQSNHARDFFRREAVVQGLKSRAAFKLLELNAQHRLFKPGATVVDLGYAPGSWSQVAVDRTQPYGRVVGVDLIPAQPPRGVSTIQGNFLSEEVQAEVRAYVRDARLGRARQVQVNRHLNDEDTGVVNEVDACGLSKERMTLLETCASTEALGSSGCEREESEKGPRMKMVSVKERDIKAGRVVDVVLSDMFAQWAQTSGFSKNSINDVYRRLMNTSGNGFRDHVKSMDLCLAAIRFAFDTLKTGGHFVCKYYQGAEDKNLEMKLKKLFEKVYREKPESSRKESREGYFVGLRRRETASREQIFDDMMSVETEGSR